MNCTKDNQNNSQNSSSKKSLAFAWICVGGALAQASHIAQIISTILALMHPLPTLPPIPPSQPTGVNDPSGAKVPFKHSRPSATKKPTASHVKSGCGVPANPSDPNSPLAQQKANVSNSNLKTDQDHPVAGPSPQDAECNADGTYSPAYETLGASTFSPEPHKAINMVSHPARHPCT
ncbi:MAG: hypothetical protein ABR907_03225 [Terracidiphilus sp.]|jgi:hypothetical protein